MTNARLAALVAALVTSSGFAVWCYANVVDERARERAESLPSAPEGEERAPQGLDPLDPRDAIELQGELRRDTEGLAWSYEIGLDGERS